MDASKTLPASWFTSQNLYNLEMRAVFHKAWYLVGPVTRFANTSTIHQELAGILVTIAHHGNDTFTATNPTGQVLKHFLTPTGLLFTTINPSAPSFDVWFPDTLLPLLNKHDFRRLPHRRSIKYPGKFNWKTMVDGYQECLHCQYTHRSFSIKYPPTFYEVWNSGTYSQHIADPNKPEDGLFLFFFPICTLNLYGGGMSSFRVCPGNGVELENWDESSGEKFATSYSSSFLESAGAAQGAGNPSSGKVGETRMEFDYYFLPSTSTPDSNDMDEAGQQEFAEYFKFVRRVAMEDFELCETAQGNLERGVYSQGCLNGEKESGVLHYQQLTRKLVTEKFKREEEEREARQRRPQRQQQQEQQREIMGFEGGDISVAAAATGEVSATA